MPHFTRFPAAVCISLGPELLKRVKKHAPGSSELERCATDLSLISASLEKSHNQSVQELNDADFARDELVEALYCGLKMWSHRSDRRSLRILAQSTIKELLADGTAWVDAPNYEETLRLDRLIEGITEHREALNTLGLSELCDALIEAQHHFVRLERAFELKDGKGYGQVVKTKILANSFHRKLEIYVALVREFTPTQIENAKRDKLLKPLARATRELQERDEENQ